MSQMSAEDRTAAIATLRLAWHMAGTITRDVASDQDADDPSSEGDEGDGSSEEEADGVHDARVALLLELIGLNAVDVALELIGTFASLTVDTWVRARGYYHLVIYTLAQKGEFKQAMDIAAQVFDKELVYQARAFGHVYRANPTPAQMKELHDRTVKGANKLMRVGGDRTSVELSDFSSVWAELWRATHDDKHLVLARTIANGLAPLHRGLAYLFLAKATGEVGDYLAAFSACKAGLMGNNTERYRAEVLHCVGHVIKTISGKFCAGLLDEHLRGRSDLTPEEIATALGGGEFNGVCEATVVTPDQAADILKELVRINPRWAEELEKALAHARTCVPLGD